MSDTGLTQETRINVRVKGRLSEYVQSLIGRHGTYENMSDLIRDLIRHDMEARQEEEEREFYHCLMSSLNSPTKPLESDYFDKKRAMVEQLQKAKSVQ